MRANIEVADRREAQAIRHGLEDPAVRAFVVVMGVMRTLPSKRAQKRVLQYVADFFEEQQEQSDLFPANKDEGNGSGEQQSAAV